MDCKDINLLDYLEGDLTGDSKEKTEAHIKDCPTCQEELDSLKFTIQSFTHLYTRNLRRDCVSPDQLAQYLDKKLDAHTTACVKNHLLTCEYCQRKLAMMEDFETGFKERKLALKIPPFPQDIKNKVADLSKESLSEKIKTILETMVPQKFKGIKITQDRISDIADKLIGFSRLPEPVYAIRKDATLPSQPEIELREERNLSKIDIDLEGYKVTIDCSEKGIKVSLKSDKYKVRGIKVRLETEFGMKLTGVTDFKGKSIIKDVPMGTYKIKISRD